MNLKSKNDMRLLESLGKGILPFLIPILISFFIMFGSIFPYMDIDLTSYAITIGALLALLTPLVIVTLTGVFWIYSEKLNILVRFISHLFLLISGYYLLWHISANLDQIGAPAVLQFGYYWVYNYYPPMIFLCALFLNLVVTNTGKYLVEEKDEKNENIEKTSNKFSYNLLDMLKSNKFIHIGVSIIGASWALIYIYLHSGMFWAFFMQMVIISIGIGSEIIKFFIILMNPSRLPEKSIGNKLEDNNSADEIEKPKVEGNNFEVKNESVPIIKQDKQLGGLRDENQDLLIVGFINFFKTFFTFLMIFVGGYINISLLTGSFLFYPNYIPLWLQFFPIVLVSIAIWGVLLKYLINRFQLFILSMVILFINSIIIAVNPHSYLISRNLILWLIALSVTGIVTSGILYSNGMVKGKLSRVFWGSFGLTFTMGGLLMACLVKTEPYLAQTYQLGFEVPAISLMFIILGLLIKKYLIKNGYKKLFLTNADKNVSDSIKNTTVSKDGLPSVSSIIDLNFISRNFKINHHKIESIMAIGIIVLMSLPMFFSYANFKVVEQETVLGTHNGDYYLWYADNLRSIDANYKPSLDSSPVNSTVKISMARGEHEGFQVVLTPWKVKNLNVWSFEPTSDLIHEVSGDRIDLGNITISIVDYVDSLSNQYPDHLLPFQRVDTALTFSGRTSYPFYIDVNIPENDSLSPGIYSTNIKFKCRDFHLPFINESHAYKERIVEFSLEVEVYNFTITKERHIATEIIWGIPEGDEWVDFFGDYRLDAYWPRGLVTAYNGTKGNLSITFDWDTWASKLAQGFENGMRYFPVRWHPSGVDWSEGVVNYTDEYETLLTWYCANLSIHLTHIDNKTSWGDNYMDLAYFFVIDEPPEYKYDLIINISKIIHSVFPELRIMETMNQPLDTYSDEFLEEVDIYCQYIHHWEPSASYPEDDVVNGWPERLNEFVSDYSGPREKELWVYHTHNRFPTPDTDLTLSGVLHRNALWLHWIYNVPGYLYWSFNWGIDNFGGYGWAGFGESNLIGYGPNDSPMSSLRLERVRDGIEDYEYFWILNDTCKQLDGLGMTTESAYGKSLLVLVNNMFNQPQHMAHLPGADTEMFDGFKWSYSLDPQEYKALRNKIGAEIGRIISLGVI